MKYVSLLASYVCACFVHLSGNLIKFHTSYIDMTVGGVGLFKGAKIENRCSVA